MSTNGYPLAISLVSIVRSLSYTLVSFASKLRCSPRIKDNLVLLIRLNITSFILTSIDLIPCLTLTTSEGFDMFLFTCWLITLAPADTN